jgi:hypothetical protein
MRVGGQGPARGIKKRTTHENRPEARPRGGGDEGADQEGQGHVTAARKTQERTGGDEGLDQAGGAQKFGEHTGKQPGQDHEGHDFLTHGTNDGFAPRGAIAGQQHADAQGSEEDGPEASLVGRSLKGEGGDAGQEDESGDERARDPAVEGKTGGRGSLGHRWLC